MVNMVDPYQMAPSGAVWSWSAMLTYAVLQELLVYNILGHLSYIAPVQRWHQHTVFSSENGAWHFMQMGKLYIMDKGAWIHFRPPRLWNCFTCSMIRQICNIKPQDIVTTRSNELLAWLGIEDLDLILKERRLCWYGHVECSNGAIKTVFDLQVDGKRGPGRDCREWKLGYRPSWQTYLEIWCEICHACSKPATWKGTHWCGCCPCTYYLHVNQTSDDDYDDAQFSWAWNFLCS